MTDFNAIAQDMETNIKNMFGDSHIVNVRYSTNLTQNINIVFYGRDPINGIRHNSHTHMQFMCHINESKFEMLLMSHHLKGHIKFRKISGKSIEDTCNKMVKWFEKNHDAIMTVHYNERAA